MADIRCAAAPSKPLVVVMGVSGCGKSTVGRLIAQRLGVPFHDGDDYHSASNRAKMAFGTPMTDEDRAPWLLELARLLQDAARERGAVLACSALKRSYRQLLNSGANKPGKESTHVAYVLVEPSPQELQNRLQRRIESHSHFMPPSLLESQLALLEYDESELAWHALPDAATGLLPPPQQIAADAVRALGLRSS